jgi:hypothetical protein
MKLNQRKMLLVLGLILGGAVLVWAAAELSGQINQMAQDAGSNAAESQIITLELIRKPVGAQGNWEQEGKIHKDILTKHDQYSQTAVKAQKEMKEQGQVSAATKEQVRQSAASFKGACDQYSSFWKGAGQPTRADLATAVGASRQASAEAVAGGMNSDTQKTLRDYLKAMGKARTEYTRLAVEKKEISDADRKDIETRLAPRSQTLVNRTQDFVNRVTNLLTQVQKTMGGGGSGGGGGDREGRKPTTPETSRDANNVRDLDRTGRETNTDANNLQSDVNSITTQQYSVRLTYLEPPRFCPCFIEGD